MQFKRAFLLSMLIMGLSPVAIAGSVTKAGHEFGITLSDYKYTEPSYMSLKATKLGVDYAGTFTLLDDRFVRFETRFATGKADYAADAVSKNNVPDRYYEIRGLIGKDYLLNGGDAISPYVGLGYRYLFNDIRSIPDGNGYRRESTYLSLPIGITHRTSLTGQSTLLSMAEIDVLIRGEQESKLSDMGAGGQDITNRQRHGYGLRLGIAYQSGPWSVGPVVTLWRIKASDVVSNYFEPKNNTVEGGIRAAFRFE